MLKERLSSGRGRHRVAIELTASRLRAVAAVTTSGGMLRLTSTVVCERPENLGSVEAEAKWMADTLDAAGIPRCSCIVSVPREEVVLKRMELPGASESDLPAMAAIAASRELPIDPETAVIDSLPVHKVDSTAEVLAAAMPASDLEAVQRRMKLAGRPARVVTLRLFGAEALAPRHGSHVVVDISGSHVEVLWVENAEPRRARSASLGSDNLDAMVGAVTLEVRRTWLAWRAEGDGPTPSRAYLSGPTTLVRNLAEPVAAITGAPAIIVNVPEGIDAAGQDLQQVRSLAGLLLAESTSRPWIDLLHPRRTPERGEQARKIVLVALLAVVIVLGSIWAWGARRESALEAQLSRVQDAADRLSPAWWRYNRDTFRVGHLELWLSAGPDLGADLVDVLEAVGPPGNVLLDEIMLSCDMKSVEAPRGTTPGDWTLPWSERIVIDAEATSRDQAEALRGRLAALETWTVATSGADAADGQRLPHDLKLQLERADVVPEPSP